MNKLTRLDGTLLCNKHEGTKRVMELRAHWTKDGLALVNWYHGDEWWHHQQRLVPQAGVRALYSVLKTEVEGNGLLLGGTP